MRKIKRISIVFLLVFSLSVFLSGPVLAAKKPVVVYTSLETEETVEYLKLAKEELPGLDIKIIRLSTGELGARMLAERNNPQADVVWGWAVTNMEDFRDRGLLDRYKPKGWNKIPAKFKDPNGYWVAIDLYMAAFVLNTQVMAKENLPKPKGWHDLINPVYRGKLIMPNPASSGTGFLQVASILEMFDPDYAKKPVKKNKAWAFLEKLDKNMGQYIKSGSKPAKLTAAGEYAIGCSFAFVYSSLKKKGFPVEMVLPSEGAGYELEANALLKGAKHKRAAKKFLDWAISERAMREYATFKLGVTLPGIPGPPDLPRLETIKLAPMDFQWQATNRGEILVIWQDKFLR
ncbi:MAG: ABC transporter substrate-binding protein [Deltaproteobacteria bacterium]|nr:ABC transporter substrate-binding protein [Deltaproteobacteria bacterium]